MLLSLFDFRKALPLKGASAERRFRMGSEERATPDREERAPHNENGGGFPLPRRCGTQQQPVLPLAPSEGMTAAAGRQVDFE